MKISHFILMTLIVGLMIPSSAAFAGDSKSIAITCTIPAIPGVNAPLVKEEIFSNEGILKESKLVKAVTEDSEIMEQKTILKHKIRYTYCIK